MLEDEEAGRERVLGIRSKAVSRKSMALLMCERVVYVLLIGFCFDRGVQKITSDYLNVGTQFYEINCSQKQRMFNIDM